MVAAAALSTQSVFDNLQAQLGLQALDSADHAPASRTSTTYGWSIKLGAIAFVVAAVAVALPLVARWMAARRTRQTAAIATVPPMPGVHPDDEVLTTTAPGTAATTPTERPTHHNRASAPGRGG